MPDSDNMYSLEDESNNESADHLSPSDGNFTSTTSNLVPEVPNVIVPDPTVRDSETPAERKAREANDEPLLNSSRGHSQPQAVYPNRNSSSYAQSSAPPSTRSHSTRTSQAPPTPTTSYAPSSYAASASSRRPLQTRLPRPRASSVYSEAPPAYTPSPSATTPLVPTPLAPTSPSDQPRNYSTFQSTMGVEDERLLGRDPESMGHPDEEPIRSPRWSRRIRRRLPPWFNWRIGLLAFVVLAVSLGFLTSSYNFFRGGNSQKIKPSLPSETPPENPTEPPEPAQPGSPAKEPLQPTYCKNAEYRFSDQIMAVDFSKDKNLTFVQSSHGHGGNAGVRVGGQVNIRQLDEGGYPRVVLEIVTNDKELLLDSLLDEELQEMRISVPKKYKSDDSENPPCVEMRATIWVPKDAELQQFKVTAIHLDVLTLDDLSLHVTDYTKLAAVVGDVVSGATSPRNYEIPGMSFDDAPDFTYVPVKQSYSLDSRIIEASTTSGKIYGNWPLYDLLGLHSTAGNVKVSVTPKPILDTDPKPAVLSISSISGYIHATEPIHTQDQIPIREYLVDIKSTSGGIHCALAFSTGIELKSTASDIAVDLLPVLDQTKLSPTQPAQLETVTTSGSTAVRILEPVWHGQDKSNGVPDFNCLQAVHKSTSADVGLRYPESWIGDIQAETTSGRLSVKGKDVKVTRSSGGWTGSDLTAYKGRSGNGSTITVRTMLGSLDAVLGDE